MEPLARPPIHASDRICAIFARLLSPETVERMGARNGPQAVRAMRNRRFKAFSKCWKIFRVQFLNDSRRALQLCARNREWPLFLREQKRRFLVELLLLRLYRSAILYKLGFRVRVGSLVYRLQTLSAGLQPSNLNRAS